MPNVRPLHAARYGRSASTTVDLITPGPVFHSNLDPTANGPWVTTDGLGFGFITNDDGLPKVIPGSATVTEGNGGVDELQSPLLVPVSLSAPSSDPVTVQWRTVFVPGGPPGQADPATDYSPTTGTVTFEPGVTLTAAGILVNGDVTVEPDEYIVFQFENPTNATIGGFWGLGFGIITNDDA